jgi:adenylate kinase
MPESDSDGATERFETFLFFGAPGSGKGTQGRVLGKLPRFFHSASGDVFRSLDTRTDLGQQFVDYSSRGVLVPDDVTVQMWKAAIDAKVESHAFKPDIDFLVLDGIPRNVEQARLIDRYCDVVQVFHLSCPDREELMRRLRKRAIKENRLDDASDDVIRRRIKGYEDETKQLFSHYSPEILTNINAQQSPIKVLQDIIYTITSLRVWQETADDVV